MAVRDTGWIQIFVENGQEAIDNIFCAFRMAEDHRVLLPVMVHLDGFHLSHMVEPMTFPEQSEVDAFLPPNDFPLPLNPAKPVAMGDFAPPVIFTEAKWAQEMNLEKSKAVILEVWNEFAKKFGRQYNPVETYRCDDCDTLLMTMGSFSETAMMAIDKMRAEGQKVGLFRIRLWRPFPYAEVRQSGRPGQDPDRSGQGHLAGPGRTGSYRNQKCSLSAGEKAQSCRLCGWAGRPRYLAR